MNNQEHPHQDELEHEYFELNAEQWAQVVEKAKSAEEVDLYMYILRSWANQQVVTWASICAFKGIDIEDLPDSRSVPLSIGSITAWVRKVTGNPKAACYMWNRSKAEWAIGANQTSSLRKALGFKKRS